MKETLDIMPTKEVNKLIELGKILLNKEEQPYLSIDLDIYLKNTADEESIQE
jgi:hypothetical protein